MAFGCGGDQRTLTSISVSPNPTTIGVSQSKQFSAIGYDQKGIQLSTDFTWSVTNSIGTIDASGLFYSGASELSGSITATAQGISGSATVSVTKKGFITGTIRNSDGGVVSGITAYVTAEPSLSAQTDSYGKYTISGISSGTVEVKTRETAVYVAASSSVFVSTGETASCNLTLMPRLSIANEYESKSDNTITVVGVVCNNGSTEAKGVSIIYQYFNEEGGQIGGKVESLGNISGLGTANFNFTVFLSELSYASKTHTVTCTSF
ncbi:MAG: hypothetical protein FD145_1390 [Candidatus Saganbacteria bacterium]|uniref:BIG2 domain-containing protein n=1 Tax=Candidatus Saganbacteria bacterium TaxID=2575572 RepID=A0A833KZX8_UNCSA|nr:MAG: hypothetical protein FD145_1390 [Candidatus Saganbacteria bacterium]